MTLHSEGKTGVNISKAKYDLICAAILAALDNQGEIAFGDLPTAVQTHLSEPLEGSINWYITTIKLDLEARSVIERIPQKTPQHLRRVQ